MTQTAPSSSSTLPGADHQGGPIKRFLQATEIDTRLLGMIGALLLIWVGFHMYGAIFNGAGAFLTPRNLWNLSVQTSSIGIMATGMVLVIVTRNIDLSVGSIIGVTGMAMGLTAAWSNCRARVRDRAPDAAGEIRRERAIDLTAQRVADQLPALPAVGERIVMLHAPQQEFGLIGRQFAIHHR